MVFRAHKAVNRGFPGSGVNSGIVFSDVLSEEAVEFLKDCIIKEPKPGTMSWA